jgi:signal peptidase I
MTPYSTVPKQDNLDSHIEYKNLLNHQKEYYNNPLASLSKLEIEIKNHMNNTPNEINDVLNIKNITYNPAVSSNVATEYLVVETSEYFSNSQYNTGDIIKFNNYQNINTNVYSSAKTFNTFINREVGHNIIDTSKTDSNKLLSNRIYIPIPYELSTSTGNVSELEWYSEFKSSSLSDVTLSGSITDTSGKLINTNLQNILVFRIKTIEKESNFMNKDSLIK